MGIVRPIPDIEAWLDAETDSWSSLPDREYKALARRWCDVFAPLVATGGCCVEGDLAMLSLKERLPAAVYVLSGIQVPRLANTGGYGAAAYRGNGMRRVLRDLANDQELILISVEFSWSCVFSHEAGAFVWEELYER